MALGAGIGLVYGAISYITYRMALGVSKRLFMALTVGGLLVRMLLCMAAIVVVLFFTDVARYPFLFSFAATFILSLAVEVFLLHRRVQQMMASAPPAAPSSNPTS